MLCLDELAQIEPKAAGIAAYMLSQGQGKARAGREGQTRKSKEWRVIYISSGEIGLADKVMEGGQKKTAGMDVRVVDIRADAGAGMGLFEELHGAKDHASFAGGLRRRWASITARQRGRGLKSLPKIPRPCVPKSESYGSNL